MPKIQIELSKKQNKKVSIFKIRNDCKTKQEAIKRIIDEHIPSEE